MSKHSAPANRGSAVPPRTLALLATGVTATVVAWGFLVFTAVDFAREARSGEAVAWVFFLLATAGAAACLFLGILLATRAVELVREPAAPARPKGGRRAAR